MKAIRLFSCVLRVALTISLFALSIFPLHSQAQVLEAWVQRYSGAVSNSNDTVVKVAIDAAGDVVVAGYTEDGVTTDMLTIKYSGVDGSVIWRARYDGLAHGKDQPGAMAIDSRGDILVTGFSSNDFYTVKYAAADATVLWEKRGPRGGATAIAIDADDNVAVTGSSGSPPGDYYTAKYSAADGALLWEHRYNGTGSDYDVARSVAVDSRGNFVVTGLSWGTGNGTDYYTVKYAADDGTVVWEQRGPSGRAEVVMVDTNDDVVVAGYSMFDYYTVKYAAGDGAVLWARRYNGPANGEEELRSMTLDPSGNVIVTGSSIGNGGAQDFYTAKYAGKNGSRLWEKRYHETNHVQFMYTSSSLAVARNGVIAITGSSGLYSGVASAQDYTTVVYWENLPPIFITVLPAGVRLRFAAISGHSYNLQRANSPTGSWETIASVIASDSNMIDYVDNDPPLGSAFYRTSTP